LSTEFLVGFKITVKASSDIIYVPTNYLTIQEAINHANDGDTIFVFSGIYYERVRVNKTIALVGENRNTTVIDGGEFGEAITISTSNTTVSGFTIRGYLSVICLERAENNCIHNNIITSNVEPAYGDGIWLWSNNNTIYNNIITNKWAGVHIASFNDNTIHGNTISDNEIGILLNLAEYNVLYGNNIIGNHIGIRLWGSNSNIIYHNNLIDNGKNAYVVRASPPLPDGSFDTWDSGYPSGGNYWSDYESAGSDDDGIGDTPYVIDENNQDNYPLMVPYFSLAQMRVLYYELLEKYNKLLVDFNILTLSYQELLMTYSSLLGNYSQLIARYDILNASYQEYLLDYFELQENYTSLLASCNSLQASYDELESGQEAIINELNNIRNLMYFFTTAILVLITTIFYFAKRKPKKQ
jgi:parallel beta-helix repeat protein